MKAQLFPGGLPVPAEHASQRSQSWPAEWLRFADPLTGREIVQFTNARATSQHPYFTGPAMIDDGSRLVFISDRTGNPNLFSSDTLTGAILQLTDNRFGTLRQYVFPWGNHVGFGKSSVSLNSRTGHVYYLQGRQVRRVNVFTAEETVIAELPTGWVTAFTHVSTDDKLLCIPVVPATAFEGEEDPHWRSAPNIPSGCNGFVSIRERLERLGLESLLWVVATDGSSQRVWATQRSWITHVQFRPHDNRHLLFNNEAIHDIPGGQRIWMCDGDTGKVWKIRPEPADKPHWNCHELWTLDGSEILYHGTQPHPETGAMTNFFGFSDLTGLKYREFFLAPAKGRGYGHFGVHPQRDRAWCDGYFGDGIINEIAPDANHVAHPTPVCRHDSQWLCQDDHPHPILSPAGKTLIFTSSRTGTANVYGVTL